MSNFTYRIRSVQRVWEVHPYAESFGQEAEHELLD